MQSIDSIEQVDVCIEASHTRPMFIFKHSTACPISAEAHQNVLAFEARAGSEAPEVHMVKVIEDRPVSNAIAEKLDVVHKSPQLILVRDGAAVWSASHYGINRDKLAEAVKLANSK